MAAGTGLFTVSLGGRMQTAVIFADTFPHAFPCKILDILTLFEIRRRNKECGSGGSAYGSGCGTSHDI